MCELRTPMQWEFLFKYYSNGNSTWALSCSKHQCHIATRDRKNGIRWKCGKQGMSKNEGLHSEPVLCNVIITIFTRYAFTPNARVAPFLLILRSRVSFMHITCIQIQHQVHTCYVCTYIACTLFCHCIWCIGNYVEIIKIL